MCNLYIDGGGNGINESGNTFYQKTFAEVEANATRTSVRSAPHYVPGLYQQFAVAHTLHDSTSLSNATPTVTAFNQITIVTGHVTTHSHTQIHLQHSTL
jgi:hypothetical protein